MNCLPMPFVDGWCRFDAAYLDVVYELHCWPHPDPERRTNRSGHDAATVTSSQWTWEKATRMVMML